jgi:hypothetical protein
MPHRALILWQPQWISLILFAQRITQSYWDRTTAQDLYPMAIDHSIETYHTSYPDAFDEPPRPPDWKSDWTSETVGGPDAPGLSALEETFPSGERTEPHLDEFMDAPSPVDRLPEAPEFGIGFPGAPIVTPSSARPPADAYAFYLPFHLFRNRGWGIYLIAERVAKLVDDFHEELRPTLSQRECKIATRLYLYEHEYFHHKAETFSTGLEVSHREEIYVEGSMPLYEEMQDTDDQLEEALAEAYALARVEKRLKKQRGWEEQKRDAFGEVLRSFMENSGPGYRRGPSIDEEGTFKEIRNEFSERVLSWSPASKGPRDSEIWVISKHIFRGLANVNSSFKYLVPAGSSLSTRAELSV